MASTKLIIRNYPGSRLADGQCIIFVRYSYLETNPVYFSTSEKIFPEYWDSKRGEAKRSFPGHKSLNSFLFAFKEKIDRIIREKKMSDSDDDAPTVTYVKQKYQELKGKKASKQKKEPIGFIQFVEQYLKDSEISKKPGTIMGYKNTFNNLKLYSKFRKVPLTWSIFDHDFYEDFRRFCSQERNNNDNSFGKIIKNIKVFLNEAVDRGLTQTTIHQNKKFKVISSMSDQIYLSEPELKKIFEVDLSVNKRLEQARDTFLVGCWTGLRFSDFTSITPEAIKDGHIDMKTIKTGADVMIPIHPWVKQIMEKYQGVNKNSLPRTFCNQIMNRYLKEIGRLAGLDESIRVTDYRGNERIDKTMKKYEMIRTHTARRSFATNLYKQGFPAIGIAKITGHSSQKSFMAYIKVDREENSQMLEKHWEETYKIDRSKRETN